MMLKTSLRTGALFSAVLVFLLSGRAFPSAGATPPDRIEALGLWLRADDLASDHKDGDRVTLWVDQSGNRFDAVFEERIPFAGPRKMGFHRPPTLKTGALGAHAAVSFDGSDRQTLLLNMAGHALGQTTSGFSAVFLVRPTLVYGPSPGPGLAWTKNRYLFLTHVSDYNTRMSVQIVEGTGEVKLFSRPIPAQARVTQNSSFAHGEQQAVTDGKWHRLMVTLDYKAKVARIVIDGLVLTRALPADSADMFENVPSPLTAIGSTTGGDWLTCQIAEMVCYDKALTVAEIEALDAYLVGKYRLSK